MSNNTISLTRYSETDFDTYYSLVKRDDVMKYITEKGLTDEQAKTKFNSIMQINAAENPLGYFRVYNADGSCIGDCKLVRYKKDPSVLEIGYLLKSEFWRMGYGSLICRELLALADQTAPSTDIIGLIDPENTASKKLLEKHGFTSCFLGIEDGLSTEKLILRRAE